MWSRVGQVGSVLGDERGGEEQRAGRPPRQERHQPGAREAEGGCLIARHPVTACSLVKTRVPLADHRQVDAL